MVSKQNKLLISAVDFGVCLILAVLVDLEVEVVTRYIWYIILVLFILRYILGKHTLIKIASIWKREN
jgi:predicted membrane-bound dolichyl-phosphate-mannose-protein mannosyltransferase